MVRPSPAVAAWRRCATSPLASTEAKFGYTEVRIGFVPAIVSTFLLRQVGEKQARDLLLTGRIISAEEAFRLGLASEVVPADKLQERARELAAELVAEQPRLAAGYQASAEKLFLAGTRPPDRRCCRRECAHSHDRRFSRRRHLVSGETQSTLDGALNRVESHGVACLSSGNSSRKVPNRVSAVYDTRQIQQHPPFSCYNASLRAFLLRLVIIRRRAERLRCSRRTPIWKGKVSECGGSCQRKGSPQRTWGEHDEISSAFDGCHLNNCFAALGPRCGTGAGAATAKPGSTSSADKRHRLQPPATSRPRRRLHPSPSEWTLSRS